jgi:hypothetical protein
MYLIPQHCGLGVNSVSNIILLRVNVQASDVDSFYVL